MPAPEGNKYAVKAEENRVAFPKAPIRGTKAERQAWNQAQAKSGLGWNDFGRQALNAAAGYVPSEPANAGGMARELAAQKPESTTDLNG